MNWSIKWPDSPLDKRESLSKPTTPFDKGRVERPIRITFHNSALKELRGFEKAALDLLSEFVEVDSPNISVLATEPGDLHFIEIGTQPNSGYIPVTVKYAEERLLKSGIMFPNQFADIATHMVNRLGGVSANHEEA